MALIGKPIPVGEPITDPPEELVDKLMRRRSSFPLPTFGRTDGRRTDDGPTTDEKSSHEKIPTKKFRRKNSDEKIPTKKLGRKNWDEKIWTKKIGGKARGQGTAAAEARHG